MFEWITAKITGWAAAVAAALAILWAVYSKGGTDEKARATEQHLKAVTKAKEVENEVDALGGDDLDRRLSKWMRD